MTPRRMLVVILAIILAVSLAVGTFAQPPQYRANDDYIAIARNQPEVFRAGTPRQISVQRGDPVVVEFTFERERYRVEIDPRTDQVTSVERR